MQNYIVQEVQHIYASQGQTINDKHTEIIARKMFSKIRILDGGDTTLLAGEVVDISDVRRANNALIKSKGKKKDYTLATYEQLLLGGPCLACNGKLVCRCIVPETIRVLVEAATTGAVDYLKGLRGKRDHRSPHPSWRNLPRAFP